jgi:esterase
VSSLRRGILHNAHQLDDGSWQWRYDRRNHTTTTSTTTTISDDAASPLWDDFSAVACPLHLVQGGTSPVVDDDDVAEARRRQPGLRLDVVDGAGHSVQGDRPVELAALLGEHLRR